LNDSLKSNIEAMMNVNIDGMKEALAKLLEERFPNGDKVILENIDEEERNMNYYSTDSLTRI